MVNNWKTEQIKVECINDYTYKWEDIDCNGTFKHTTTIEKGEQIGVIKTTNLKSSYLSFTLYPSPFYLSDSDIVKKDIFDKHFKIIG